MQMSRRFSVNKEGQLVKTGFVLALWSLAVMPTLAQQGGDKNYTAPGYQQQPGYLDQTQPGYSPGGMPANYQQGYPGGYQSGGYPAQYPQYPAYPAGQPGGFQGGQPGPGYQSGYGSRPAPKPADPQVQAKVYQWFLKYDDVRRRAQMSPIEKQQADAILSRGLSILMPGPDKLAAREIMSKLVTRYQTATQQLSAVPALPETENLRRGYLQYFGTASGLFGDYLKVQDNLMAKDANGQPIMAQLLQRKQGLETLEHGVKELDSQVRMTYGIQAYSY